MNIKFFCLIVLLSQFGLKAGDAKELAAEQKLANRKYRSEYHPFSQRKRLPGERWLDNARLEDDVCVILVPCSDQMHKVSTVWPVQHDMGGDMNPAAQGAPTWYVSTIKPDGRDYRVDN